MAAVGKLLGSAAPGAGAGYTQIIDVAETYGIVADGETDNATALLAMRTALAGLNKPHYQLIFPSYGEMLYSDNRWLYNIQSFEAVSSKIVFRSIRGGDWGTEWQPLQAGDMFTKNVMTSYNPTGSFETGHLFDTVDAGSTTITLDTSGDHSNYTVGGRIFICGFDKTLDGYPPNPMYFEWATIKAINTGTGVITLDRRLKHSYNSAWKDSANGLGSDPFGKPRIYSIDRDDYHFPRYVKFSGITFGNGTKDTGTPVDLTGILQFPAEMLVIERCKTEFAFWAAQNQQIFMSSSITLGDSEFDKIVDYAEFTDSSFDGHFANATSCNRLVLKRNNFADYCFIAPYILEAEDNDFTNGTDGAGVGSLVQGFGGEYIKQAVLKNNRFKNIDAASGVPHIEMGRIYSVTLDGASGNDMLVDDDGSNNQVAYTLRKGVEMWKADGSKRGKVLDVEHNGTQWVIKGTWAAPSSSEVWNFSSIGELIDSGNEVLNGKGPLFNGAVARFRGNQGGSGGLRTTVIREDTLNIVDNGGTFTMHLHGTLLDVTVNVIKPYSGSNDNAHLLLQTNPGDVQNVDLNLMATGRRVLTASGLTGNQTGDSGTVATTNLGGFVTTLQIIAMNYTNFQKIAITNPQDMPQLEIILRWYPQ